MVPVTYFQKSFIFITGLLKSIGVSNYTVDHLEDLLQYATVVPAVLQVLNVFSIDYGDNNIGSITELFSIN